MELRNRPAGAMDMNSKKAQEEIMGFMLVVIMVIVIGMAFLFFFTPRATEKNDLDMQNLLYAWLSTTLDGKAVKTTISECAGGCDLSQSSAVLEQVITKTGTITRINGYSLDINGTAEFSYQKGVLKGNSTKTAVVVVDNENEARLKFYYP